MTRTSSPGPTWPTNWILTSYWSDQKNGTGRNGSGVPPGRGGRRVPAPAAPRPAPGGRARRRGRGGGGPGARGGGGARGAKDPRPDDDGPRPRLEGGADGEGVLHRAQLVDALQRRRPRQAARDRAGGDHQPV